MQSQNQGLTVGELTLAIGAILVVTLIWSTAVKKKDSNDTSKLIAPAESTSNLYKRNSELT